MIWIKYSKGSFQEPDVVKSHFLEFEFEFLAKHHSAFEQSKLVNDCLNVQLLLRLCLSGVERHRSG